MRVEPTQPITPSEVETAQNQLLRAGFSLPRYGADGLFGRETSAAVTRFQKANGLPATGTLDLDTLHALANAKSPSPDYAALFSDGVLRAVLAVGYDEVGSHEPEQERVLSGLVDRGYTAVTDDQRATLGLDAEGRYVTRQLEQGTVIIELITPDLTNAKTRFAEALRRDELVLYGGHGRYGSGPDFDDLRSPAGNFVIGHPFEAGHVTLGPNDLQAAPLTSEYQLMFFDGCNTFRYFDDLRSRTPGKTTKNLDVIGSTTELYWNVTAANLLALLDGVTEQRNLEQLEASLDVVNRAGPADQTRYFRADGFEDN
ncbi:MAG: peptidoglycan-binding domain-containing protein [Archangium sp.]|nr:peptidoglycan-binding domain-containing protein [Archangium sp.]